MSKHVFFGKFCIEQTDGTDEYRVSAMPMSDKERDALAGIVRCRDCKHFDEHYTDGALFDETVCWSWDNGNDYPHYTSPDGFCYRGERKEETE